MYSEKIKIAELTVEVYKLPLKKFTEVLTILEELPKTVADLPNLSNDQIVANLPRIIAKALPEFTKILAMGTSLKEEEIGELSLDEVVKVFVKFWKVNNFSGILDSLKELTAPKAS